MKKKINRRTFLKVMGAEALAASAGGLSGCGSTGENGEKSTIIRVQDSDTYIQMINLVGGVGIAMGQSEVYAAVQQHVIEGGENSEVVYINESNRELRWQGASYSGTHPIFVAIFTIT